MSKHVYWILELEIRQGRERDFHELMHEMIADIRENEPGTLAYEWSVSDNGRRCHIFERYSNSAAVMVHLAKFGEAYAERFFNMLNLTGFVVYGSPSQLVKDALSTLEPSFMKLSDGFTR